MPLQFMRHQRNLCDGIMTNSTLLVGAVHMGNGKRHHFIVAVASRAVGLVRNRVRDLRDLVVHIGVACAANRVGASYMVGGQRRDLVRGVTAGAVALAF